MRKKYIRKRFALSLDTYEQHAVAQAIIADRLFSRVKDHLSSPPRTLLEIGCGTGFLTKNLRLHFPNSTLYLNDLNEKAGELLQKFSPLFIPGDAESIGLPSSLDLVISASTFQWFSNLPDFFQKMRRLFNNHGMLAFSTFGKDNLRELRLLEGKGLNYLTREEISQSLEQSGFSLLHSSEELLTLPFSSPTDVLRHLKLTGVNASFSTTPWTKGKLADFSARYREQFSISKGVSLTYHPLYFIAQLP